MTKSTYRTMVFTLQLADWLIVYFLDRILTISDDKEYISHNVFTLQLADWLIVYFLDRILTISDDK